MSSSVPLYLDWMGRLSERHQKTILKLGRLETKLLTYDIDDIQVEKPIFVTSLARSGTTILLEVLNSHPACGSHHYGDYPFPHISHFWNTLRLFFPVPDKKAERAHKDRLKVNKKSPEAIDEMIWMSFFEDIHNIEKNNELDGNVSNSGFEEFFTAHIRKLLYLRKGKRYLSKNNYNVSRIDYLLKVFPDARFVIPVRDPLSHIYSMVKQHRLIAEAQKDDKRAANFMRRHGHFEFGVDFRPVNLGFDDAAYQEILKCWEAEEIVRSFALYWDYMHRYIYEHIMQNKDYAKACMIVRYDDLCDHTEQRLKDIMEFCSLDPCEGVMGWCDKITPPDYYKIDFTDEEREMIETTTAKTKALFWS